MSYEDIAKYPRVHIIGSHGQIDYFIRNHQPPETPFQATVDLSGSATTVKYLENIFKYFDQVNIGYGATETSRTCNKRLYSVEDFNGSSGFPLPDVEIRIGENGAIGVKSPRVHKEGIEWFEPGDLGYMENGELFITGRKNEQLNVGGVKIDPKSVEDEIRSIVGVSDCMVFIDDIQPVEYQLSVLVVADAEVSREIHIKCFAKFGISKIPQNIYYVNELPKTEGGKVSRKLAMDVVKEFKHTKYVYVYN
jgi:long-chain acyl-CoA synthetase